MNRAVSVVLLALAAAFSDFAQEKAAETKPAATAETRLPSADEILDKYVEALGGKAAFEKFRSRVVKGALELPAMGITSGAEIYAKAPNKWLLSIEVPGFGLVQQGYDGTSGWARDPQTGIRDLSGGELESIKRGAEFNQPLKLKALFPKLEVKEKSKVGDREVYVLEANPRASRTVPFVAKATGVPLVEHACRLLLGESLGSLGLPERVVPARAWAKEAVFPTDRFPRAAVRGPEMRSTGEVMASGATPAAAYARALRAAGRSRRGGQIGPPLQRV